MTKWCMVEPDSNFEPVYSIYTEEEILDHYYEHWKRGMISVGKRHLISKERCIEDWATVHWAWRL